LRWYAPALALGVSAGVVLILLLAGFLDAFDGPNAWCAANGLPCNAGLDVVAAGVLGSLAYFVVFFWHRNRVVQRYLNQVADHPERYVRNAPVSYVSTGVVGAGTKALLDDLLADCELWGSARPGLIIGSAASGKSTFITALLGKLGRQAQQRFSPIPVSISLRDATEFDFHAMAKRAFLNAVDSELRSEGDGDAIWRRLSAIRGVVVLADELEAAATSSKSLRDEMLARALATAQDEGTPVVLSALDSAAPDAVPASAFVLPPLGLSGALEFVHGLTRAPPTKPMETLLDQAAGEFLRSPFFLELLIELAATDLLPVPADDSPRQTQHAVLGAYVDGLERAALRRGIAPTGAATRCHMVQLLGSIALGMLITGSRSASLGALRASWLDHDKATPTLPALAESVAVGVRFGFVEETATDTTIEFRNPLMQAYLAARALRRVPKSGPDAWCDLLATGAEDINLWALEFLAVRVETETVDQQADRCRVLVAALVAAAERAVSPNERMRITRAMTEIALLVGLEPGTTPEKAVDFEADRTEKLAAQSVLVQMENAWGYWALWRHVNDPSDFPTRWAAFKALARSPAAAYDVLTEDFDRVISAAQRERTRGIDDPDVNFAVSVLGWVLPALAVSGERPRSKRYQRQLEDLIDLAVDGPWSPTGPENSVARGFKLATLIHAESAELHRPLIEELIVRTRFWHSRVSLVHALAAPLLRRETVKPSCSRVVERLQRIESAEDEHPFVRETASTVLETMADSTAHWSYAIWEVEGYATSHAGHPLRPRASRLIGDIALLLSLTYCSDREADEKVWSPTELPPCLRGDRGRTEMLAAVRCSCRFKLCPFPDRGAVASARGEISQAFCRRQAAISADLGPGSWIGAGLSGRKLQDFWLEMERHVATMRPLVQVWTGMEHVANDRA